MPKPLSLDLRQRLVNRWLQGGIDVAELADVYMVSEASVRRWLALYSDTGSVAPRPHGGGRQARIDEAGRVWLRQFVENNPDLNTYETTDAFNAWRGTPVHRSIVLRAMRAMGLTRKKSRSWRPSGKASSSKRGASNTSKPSRKSTVRVWFSWTKPASTSH